MRLFRMLSLLLVVVAPAAFADSPYQVEMILVRQNAEPLIVSRAAPEDWAAGAQRLSPDSLRTPALGSIVEKLGASGSYSVLGECLARAPQQAHVYTCGPSGFMEWVIGEAKRLGVPEAQIHKEYFQATTDTAGAAFEVVAKKSGKTVQVADGQSIVDALATVGIKVTVSCEQGVCGTCVTRWLDGEPDHRDSCLSAAEQATHVAVCCARCHGPTLTLDL